MTLQEEIIIAARDLADKLDDYLERKCTRQVLVQAKEQLKKLIQECEN